VSTPQQHTADEARTLLGCGELTAVELAEFYLARIDELNPELHAVIAVDRHGALAAAHEADSRRAADMAASPLDGVPVLIKDNIEALGLPGTAGSRALLNSPPAADAPLVARLRRAGLVVLGSTNLSEWANFRSTTSTSGWSAVGGQTTNPYDTSRNTSGSSSGSAASIAAGLAPLSVGTETDGSIVSPAGVCGIVGFKPTLGTVPGQGIVPISSLQDTAGPMTRTVADAAQLYALLSGTTVAPATLGLDGLRIGIWRPDDLPAEVAAVLEECGRRLAAAGCELVPAAGAASGPFETAEFDALVAEFAADLPRYLVRRAGDHPKTWPELLAFNRADEVELSRFGDEVFELAAAAPALDADAYRSAREQANTSAATALSTLLASADIAIAPTNSPAWPIRYGASEDDHVLTSSLCAVTGSPSITLPAGMVDGLPVGVSVLGRRGDDARVLAFAAAVEAILPTPMRVR
jgi:amidase